MAAERTLIRGGTLLVPSPKGGLEARAGDVWLEGDRIAAVGRREPAGAVPAEDGSAGEQTTEEGSASRERRADHVVDASGHAVVPGFVQTHVHLCQTLFRGAADDLSLLDWLQQRVWPLEAAHTPESLRASARLGVAELLAGGTTGIQTMETVRHTEVVLEVLLEAGMFAVAGKCLMDDPETCPEELRQTTDVALQEAVDLAEDWDGRGDGRLRVCLAPRFAVSCTDECLRQVGELAGRRLWRIHTHASENRDEVDLVRRRTGSGNVAYLEDVGCAGHHVGLAHCVWLDDGDLERLARSGTHVLHCPTSNLKLGSGIAVVPEMLDAGVSVSLGADGAPCNNALDMFREMRLAALIQKSRRGPAAMPAPTVLDLATRRGAEALGQAGKLGVLATGAWADLTLVDLRGFHTTPSPDVASTLVYGARSADVRHVWLRGRRVVEDGRLTLWDEEEVRREAVAEAGALYERAGLELPTTAPRPRLDL